MDDCNHVTGSQNGELEDEAYDEIDEDHWEHHIDPDERDEFQNYLLQEKAAAAANLKGGGTAKSRGTTSGSYNTSSTNLSTDGSFSGIDENGWSREDRKFTKLHGGGPTKRAKKQKDKIKLLSPTPSILMKQQHQTQKSESTFRNESLTDSDDQQQRATDRHYENLKNYAADLTKVSKQQNEKGQRVMGKLERAMDKLDRANLQKIEVNEGKYREVMRNRFTESFFEFYGPFNRGIRNITEMESAVVRQRTIVEGKEGTNRERVDLSEQSERERIWDDIEKHYQIIPNNHMSAVPSMMIAGMEMDHSGMRDAQATHNSRPSPSPTLSAASAPASRLRSTVVGEMSADFTNNSLNASQWKVLSDKRNPTSPTTLLSPTTNQASAITDSNDAVFSQRKNPASGSQNGGVVPASSSSSFSPVSASGYKLGSSGAKISPRSQLAPGVTNHSLSDLSSAPSAARLGAELSGVDYMVSLAQSRNASGQFHSSPSGGGGNVGGGGAPSQVSLFGAPSYASPHQQQQQQTVASSSGFLADQHPHHGHGNLTAQATVATLIQAKSSNDISKAVSGSSAPASDGELTVRTGTTTSSSAAAWEKSRRTSGGVVEVEPSPLRPLSQHLPVPALAAMANFSSNTLSNASSGIQSANATSGGSASHSLPGNNIPNPTIEHGSQSAVKSHETNSIVGQSAQQLGLLQQQQVAAPATLQQASSTSYNNVSPVSSLVPPQPPINNSPPKSPSQMAAVAAVTGHSALAIPNSPGLSGARRPAKPLWREDTANPAELVTTGTNLGDFPSTAFSSQYASLHIAPSTSHHFNPALQFLGAVDGDRNSTVQDSNPLFSEDRQTHSSSTSNPMLQSLTPPSRSQPISIGVPNTATSIPPFLPPGGPQSIQQQQQQYPLLHHNPPTATTLQLTTLASAGVGSSTNVLVPVPSTQLLSLVSNLEAHDQLKADYRLLQATHEELLKDLEALQKQLNNAKEIIALQRTMLGGSAAATAAPSLSQSGAELYASTSGIRRPPQLQRPSVATIGEEYYIGTPNTTPRSHNPSYHSFADRPKAAQQTTTYNASNIDISRQEQRNPQPSAFGNSLNYNPNFSHINESPSAQSPSPIHVRADLSRRLSPPRYTIDGHREAQHRPLTAEQAPYGHSAPAAVTSAPQRPTFISEFTPLPHRHQHSHHFNHNKEVGFVETPRGSGDYNHLLNTEDKKSYAGSDRRSIAVPETSFRDMSVSSSIPYTSNRMMPQRATQQQFTAAHSPTSYSQTQYFSQTAAPNLNVVSYAPTAPPVLFPSSASVAAPNSNSGTRWTPLR
eukprot:GILJ01020341.1.p1 GENE.GILJ01020341.1~~GILJ01020341.1.p1  ORF type:complete len:1486 (-),score=215.35 GILJ01020341.1:68-3973(-)